MKIAVWHNLPSGGGKRQLYAHIKGLVERGHSIKAWAPSSANQSYLPLSELIQEQVLAIPQIGWVPPKEKRLDKKITALYRHTRATLAIMNRHCQTCATQIQRENFDILFGNPCMYLAAPPIAQMVELPSLLYLAEPKRSLHEADPRSPWLAPTPLKSKWSVREWERWLTDAWDNYARRLLARGEYENAAAFDLILSNSFYSAESIMRAYGLPSQVCYLGIDSRQFYPTGVPREKFIIGVGAIHPSKAVERAIRALGIIPETLRPELVWVANFANPGYRKKIEQLSQSLGVRFSPYINITDEKLLDLLNRASMMVYTPKLEPFGLAPLEANACETPVVAIAQGGVRESIQDGVNGILVPNGEPETLAQAILQILESPEHARKLGKQARAHVLSHWTLESAIDRLEQYLFQVLRGKGSGQTETDLLPQDAVG